PPHRLGGIVPLCNKWPHHAMVRKRAECACTRRPQQQVPRLVILLVMGIRMRSCPAYKRSIRHPRDSGNIPGAVRPNGPEIEAILPDLKQVSLDPPEDPPSAI